MKTPGQVRQALHEAESAQSRARGSWTSREAGLLSSVAEKSAAVLGLQEALAAAEEREAELAVQCATATHEETAMRNQLDDVVARAVTQGKHLERQVAAVSALRSETAQREEMAEAAAEAAGVVEANLRLQCAELERHLAAADRTADLQRAQDTLARQTEQHSAALGNLQTELDGVQGQLHASRAKLDKQIAQAKTQSAREATLVSAAAEQEQRLEAGAQQLQGVTQELEDERAKAEAASEAAAAALAAKEAELEAALAAHSSAVEAQRADAQAVADAQSEAHRAELAAAISAKASEIKRESEEQEQGWQKQQAQLQADADKQRADAAAWSAREAALVSAAAEQEQRLEAGAQQLQGVTQELEDERAKAEAASEAAAAALAAKEVELEAALAAHSSAMEAQRAAFTQTPRRTELAANLQMQIAEVERHLAAADTSGHPDTHGDTNEQVTSFAERFEAGRVDEEVIEDEQLVGRVPDDEIAATGTVLQNISVEAKEVKLGGSNSHTELEKSDVSVDVGDDALQMVHEAHGAIPEEQGNSQQRSDTPNAGSNALTDLLASESSASEEEVHDTHRHLTVHDDGPAQAMVTDHGNDAGADLRTNDEAVGATEAVGPEPGFGGLQGISIDFDLDASDSDSGDEAMTSSIANQVIPSSSTRTVRSDPTNTSGGFIAPTNAMDFDLFLAESDSDEDAEEATVAAPATMPVANKSDALGTQGSLAPSTPIADSHSSNTSGAIQAPTNAMDFESFLAESDSDADAEDVAVTTSGVTAAVVTVVDDTKRPEAEQDSSNLACAATEAQPVEEVGTDQTRFRQAVEMWAKATDTELHPGTASMHGADDEGPKPNTDVGDVGEKLQQPVGTIAIGTNAIVPSQPSTDVADPVSRSPNAFDNEAAPELDDEASSATPATQTASERDDALHVAGFKGTVQDMVAHGSSAQLVPTLKAVLLGVYVNTIGRRQQAAAAAAKERRAAKRAAAQAQALPAAAVEALSMGLRVCVVVSRPVFHCMRQSLWSKIMPAPLHMRMSSGHASNMNSRRTLLGISACKQGSWLLLQRAKRYVLAVGVMAMCGSL
eukprot:COSAG01_NODE_2015_length_8643_cov_8.718984_2_plen_1069_part_00